MDIFGMNGATYTIGEGIVFDGNNDNYVNLVNETSSPMTIALWKLLGKLGLRDRLAKSVVLLRGCGRRGKRDAYCCIFCVAHEQRSYTSRLVFSEDDDYENFALIVVIQITI